MYKNSTYFAYFNVQAKCKLKPVVYFYYTSVFRVSDQLTYLSLVGWFQFKVKTETSSSSSRLT